MFLGIIEVSRGFRGVSFGLTGLQGVSMGIFDMFQKVSKNFRGIQ